MNETHTEIKVVKEIVLDLLASDARCRNDDKWLIWRYLTKDVVDVPMDYHFMDFKMFERSPSFETITRVRRRIQNVDKMFPPTDEIGKQRKDRQKVFRYIQGV